MEHNRRQQVAAAYFHDSITLDTSTVYSGEGGLQQRLKALRQKYSLGNPRRVLRAGEFKSHGIYVCYYYVLYAFHFRRLVGEAADMGLSDYSAKSRTAVSRAHPSWGEV